MTAIPLGVSVSPLLLAYTPFHFSLIFLEIFSHLRLQLADALKKCILERVPSIHNEQELYEAVLKRTLEFETVITKLGLVESTKELSETVTKAGSSQATNSRREELLLLARDILCSGNFNTVRVFSFPSWLTSSL